VDSVPGVVITFNEQGGGGGGGGGNLRGGSRGLHGTQTGRQAVKATTLLSDPGQRLQESRVFGRSCSQIMTDEGWLRACIHDRRMQCDIDTNADQRCR
jgi:hypothetical protein